MDEVAMQKDQLRSLLAHSSSGTPPTEQQSDTVDNINTTADGEAHLDATSLWTAAEWNSNDDDMLKSANTSAWSNFGDQSDTALDAGLSKSRRQRGYTSDMETEDIQTNDHQYDGQKSSETTEALFDVLTPSERPPFARSESSFADSTKASRGWQTERSQTSPSVSLPWKPAGSPSVPRPGGAHQSTDHVSLSRANSQISERLGRSETSHSRRLHLERRSSLTSEHELPKDETTSETEGHPDRERIASNLGTSSTDWSSKLDETSRSAQFAGKDMQECYGNPVGPDYDDLSRENQYLRNELHLADENRSRCNTELRELSSDLSHLCDAWSKACAAAELSFDAVKDFHFLVTHAEVDPKSRAEAYQELKANELCRTINHLRDSAQYVELENSKHKDEVIATYQAEFALRCGGLVDGTGAQHDSIKWRTLYEKEQKRSEVLKERYKRLKFEAERMYQPDSERKHRECQAKLIEAQDRVVVLTGATNQAKAEALSWKDEVIQLKDEFARREAQFDTQTRTNNKEMLEVIKDYREKIHDSQRWDKDGLLRKYEKLEYEQIVLMKELEYVKRTNAIMDDDYRKLSEKHQQDQREIDELRRAISADRLVALRGETRESALEDVDELRGRLTKQRKAEDAEEALKEKVRQMRLQDQRIPIDLKLKNTEAQDWFARWKGYAYFDKLTEEEREVSKRL